MKALVYHGPRKLVWEDWPTPVAGPGEVVVSVRAVGICGSDIHGYTGESGRRIPPMVMGHEFTGVVERSAEANGWAGKPVIVRPFVHCGTCPECRSGRINLCRNRRFMGANAEGGMAESVAVPVGNLLPLDPNVTFAQGTLTEPLAVGIHAAGMAGDLRGKRVFICGGGAIGLLTLIAVREGGADAITVVDLLEERRQAAAALGATATAAPDSDVGADYDVAFDAAGLAPTFAQTLSAVELGGTAVALGGWRSVPIDLRRLVAREITLRGSFNFTPDEFARAARWLSEGRVDTARLMSGMQKLSEGARVFEDIAARRIGGVKIMLTNND